MADETVIIAVDGDASGWRREIRQVETAGVAAARKIDSAFSAATKHTSAEFKDLKGALSASFGGVVGDLEDVASAIASLGPVTGSAVLGLAGAAGLTAALYAAANASGELDEEQAALQASVERLSKSVGAAASGPFARFLDGLRQVTDGFTIAGAVAGAFFDEFTTEMAIVIGNIKAIAEADVAGMKAWGKAAANVKGYSAAIADAKREAEDAIVAERLADAAENASAEGRIRAEQGLAKATQMAERLAREAETAQRKAETSTRGHAAALREVATATAEWSAEVAAGPMYTLPEDSQRVAAAAQALQGALNAAHDEQMQNIRDEFAAEDEKMAASRAALGDYAMASIATAAEVASAIASSAEEGSAAQQTAALVAYAAQQTGALAQVGIDAYALGSALSVALAPALGPLALPAAVALAAGQAAAATAGILAVPAPQVAHVGAVVGQPGRLAPTTTNAPDEMTVRARPGEEIVPRGRRSDEPAPVVVIQYNHRLYDAADADRSRMSRNPYRRLALTGRVPGHR